jgi:hypothetical protein
MSRKIGNASGQCFHGFVGAGHSRIECHVRILRVKAVQDRRNEALDRGLEATDIDRAGLDVLQRGDMGFDPREFAHHAFEFLLQYFSRWRERHSLGPPVEDRCT